ncbi:MAG: hypothetical protein ACJAVQ_001141, partial [Nonlabens sp.]
MRKIYKALLVSLMILTGSISFGQITLNGCDNLFGNQDFIFANVGTDATGRNIYETTPLDGNQSCAFGFCEFRISWNTGSNRWELVADDGNDIIFFNGTNLIFHNTSASTPNPPDLTLGIWIDDTPGGSCLGNGFDTLTGDVQSTLTTTIFTAPTDVCINAGLQTLLGGGLPTGGVYSGTGVIDHANGMTYSFDPAAAGVGTHTVTYTNGTSASDDVEVFALPTVTFTSPSDFCINEGVQTGLSSGSPVAQITAPLFSVNNEATGLNSDLLETPFTITFSDGSTGNQLQMVGWTWSGLTSVGVANLNSKFPLSADQRDMIVFMNGALFGGGVSEKVMSQTLGENLEQGVTYVLTGDFGQRLDNTIGAPPVLRLYAGTTLLTPVSETSPSLSQGEFVTWTRTYTVLDPLISGRLRLETGMAANINGQQLNIDQISLTKDGTLLDVENSDFESLLKHGLNALNGAYSGPGVTDDGNGMTYSFDPLAAGVGTHTITYTFTDANGCSNTASDDTEVIDLDNATSVSYSAAAYCPNELDPTPVVSGLGGGIFTSTAGLIIDPNTGVVDLDNSTQGTYSITYTTNGFCPNTSIVSVTIFDNTPPNPDVSVLADVTSDCSVTSLVAPTAMDNCAPTVIVTNDAMLPITTQGTTLVTWTYDDGNGNTSTQIQNVIIDDVTAPTPDGPAFDVITECEILVLVAPTATDNCTNATVTVTNDAILPIVGNGITVVTWTYDDGNGNTSTQTQNVIIDDVTAPTPNVVALADVTGECSVIILVAPTATDNCTNAIVTATNDAALPIVGNGTTLVTWTYDDGNGNTSTQTQNVIIDDVTAPTPDVPALADVTAECEVTSLVAPTGTDNCVATVIVTNDVTLPITTQGTTLVTWTYDDGNGNTSTQTQNIIIDDLTAPTPDGPALDVTAECEILFLVAPTATDNCTNAMVTVTNN